MDINLVALMGFVFIFTVIPLVEFFRKINNKKHMGDELGFDKEKEIFPDKILKEEERRLKKEQKRQEKMNKMLDQEEKEEKILINSKSKSSIYDELEDDNVEIQELQEVDKSDFYS